MSISGINGSYPLLNTNKTENAQRVTDTSGKPQKATLLLDWLRSIINTTRDKTTNAEIGETFGKNGTYTTTDTTKIDNNQKTHDMQKDVQLARVLLNLIKSTNHTAYGSVCEVNKHVGNIFLNLEKEKVDLRDIQQEARELTCTLRNDLEYTEKTANNYGAPTHSGSRYAQDIALAAVRYKAAKAIQHNNIKILPRDIQNRIKQDMLKNQN